MNHEQQEDKGLLVLFAREMNINQSLDGVLLLLVKSLVLKITEDAFVHDEGEGDGAEMPEGVGVEERPDGGEVEELEEGHGVDADDGDDEEVDVAAVAVLEGPAEPEEGADEGEDGVDEGVEAVVEDDEGHVADVGKVEEEDEHQHQHLLLQPQQQRPRDGDPQAPDDDREGAKVVQLLRQVRVTRVEHRTPRPRV